MSKVINIPVINAGRPINNEHIITTDIDTIIRIESQTKGAWLNGQWTPSPKGEKEYSVTFSDGRSYNITKAVYSIIKRKKYSD